MEGDMKRFPASIPRSMYWSNDIGGTSRCPQCGGPLTGEQHTYVLSIREGDETMMSLAGNDGGHFCEVCPTVVLDSEVFARFAMLGLGRASAGELTVPGIVDLSAIPEDKKSIPLGEDDNPIPLVEFSNYADSSTPTGRGATGARRPKRKRPQGRKKKRRRR